MFKPAALFLSRLRLSLVVLSLCWPLALPAAPVIVAIHDYAVSVGKRHDYFDGKLLTAGDLSGDQQYLRGTQSVLGDPAQVLGDPTLTLTDLFGVGGRADAYLSVDCVAWPCGTRSDPLNPQDPHHDDLVFLIPERGTWFGQLYLQGVEGVAPGTYANLTGNFDRFVAIDEPASVALVGLALMGFGIGAVRVRWPRRAWTARGRHGSWASGHRLPALNRFLGHMAPTRAGNGVFALGQGADGLLQFASLQPFPAGQRTQDGQAKQGDRMDSIHDDFSG